MQILLACAKIMNERCRVVNVPLTIPRFEPEAESFVKDMQQYNEATLPEMLSVSETIARENVLRYRTFFGCEPMPAILAYHGQAYKHLKAETLTDVQLEYAHRHVWICSFLYGLLRPLDGIRPYRLEGNLYLPSAEDGTLFEFWRKRLTDMLIEAVNADDGVLVHLATEEFQHLFDWARVCREVRVVQPLFYIRTAGGLKMQAVWAKSCRGAMTRWLLEHPSVSKDELCGFAYEGFRFAPEMSDEKLIFVKD